MSGETDLQTLLRSLSPQLIDGEFVFLSFENSRYGDHSELQPIAAFSETEGLTLVVPRSAADAQGLFYDCVFRAITLKVHSSLEAVGLTAAFAGTLTDHGISANVIAGFYHDHIFVQTDRADEAITALKELARAPLSR